MRAIKFRGKTVNNGEWVEGNLLSINNHYEIGWQESSTYEEEGGWYQEEVQSDTIGQFTGLHDKDGKEIYEGDIIQGEYDYKHLIRYDEQRAQFTATLLEYVGDKIFDKSNAGNVYQQWIDEFKKVVVGNRFDNHELLKRSEQ